MKTTLKRRKEEEKSPWAMKAETTLETDREGRDVLVGMCLTMRAATTQGMRMEERDTFWGMCLKKMRKKRSGTRKEEGDILDPECQIRKVSTKSEIMTEREGIWEVLSLTKSTRTG